MENFTPISSLVGGLLIGISVSMMLLLNGRITGISGILNTGLRTTSKSLWRWFFLLGLVISGLVYEYFFKAYELSHNNSSAQLLIVGGILVGFGTRLGSGCTSGHGVCGIARLSLRSIVATLLFMSSAMLTVFITRYIV